MTEFLHVFIYNMPSEVSTPQLIETFANIIVSILTGVVAILGLGCIKPLKDKTRAATFTFWSQLSVRLVVIKKWIEQDEGVLINMYCNEAQKQLTTLGSHANRITEFKKIVQDVLHFIEDANDQMPAYRGWSEDYTELIGNLTDMLIYDICNSTRYFKYNSVTTDVTYKANCKAICDNIDRICLGIKENQNKMEKKIVRHGFSLRKHHKHTQNPDMGNN